MDTDASHPAWMVQVNMENWGSSDTAALPDSEDEDLAVQDYVREIEYRQSISNQLRVGLYESDHSTQTDVSEVVAIKELTIVIQSLTQSFNTLKKEVILQKQFLKAEYDQKIETRALEIYTRMNETVRDLEMVHKKKVSTLRRSFQQQLIDALAVIRSKYENHYFGNSELSKSNDAQADSAKIQELRRKIIEKDLVIQSMEAQIAELVDNEPPKQIIYQSEDDPEKEKLLEENKELHEKADSLQDRVHQLEIVLKEKDRHIQSLDLDVGAMRVRMEEDQRTIEKLSSAQEQLKAELKNEKSAGATLLQQQKEDMENILKKKLAEKDKEQLQLQKENEEKALHEIERQKQELMHEEERLRKMREKIKTPKVDGNIMNADKERLEAQIRRLLSGKEDDAKTIERLQRELERLNKTWEKKFDILKQSFHAIKDEMFLRQSLHRQAMNLHRVSVSYMTDGSLGAAPTDLPGRSHFYLPSMPLPQIGAKPPAVMTRTGFPSNLMDSSEQALFPEDELQVVSDTEEDFGGVPPLPPPPPDRMKENQVKQL
ncbi:uncharacterized protein C10orf67 homolog, mitochondrial [Hyla sarda]|uniref:uncharacterized protein C10orf67 homolog, mitochondrial n=1 Tax=Hyla sarda TaxID=327740 RepID=UPI0024C376DB|nr:uncharacterized protein C10orf67 homolog, mitochondrial [Hyla sarda]